MSTQPQANTPSTRLRLGEAAVVLAGGFLLGAAAVSAMHEVTPQSTVQPAGTHTVAEAHTPEPSELPIPRPVRRDKAPGAYIRYRDVAFVLPEGWIIHRPTLVSYGLSSPVLYLSNQPMHDECEVTYTRDAESWSCGWPLENMARHGILVDWSISYLNPPELPPGEPLNLHGRKATRTAFDHSLCLGTGADGGFTVTMDMGEDYYRHSFTICSRSVSRLGAQQIDVFINSLRSIESQPDEPDLAGMLQGDPGLEGGCAWLVDADGIAWDVIWSDDYHIGFRGTEAVLLGRVGQLIAEEGDLIGIDGSPTTGLGNRCRLARSFAMTYIRAIDDPNDPNN